MSNSKQIADLFSDADVPQTADGILRSADISKCGRFRWSLRRAWAGGDTRTVCFVMLNPSTADGLVDDPTIRRCIGFARDWGFSALEVRNLFPFRATDPRDLRGVPDADGGQRGEAELLAALRMDVVVAAWGANEVRGRDEWFNTKAMLTPDKILLCLGRTKGGHPRHPLYVPRKQELVVFRLFGIQA